MDPYGNAANQYGQEMQFGVRLQDALNQRQAEMPNQLFDRFMQSYQAQIKQRMLEQQMARQQQHEDTYLQMAKTRQDRADDQAKADFANWVSKNYKEGRDDGVALLMGKAAGLDVDSIKAMLPKGITGPTGGGEKISEPGSEGISSLAEGDAGPNLPSSTAAGTMPLPTGARAPLDISMPQTPGAYTPGMGQGVAYQEGEQARKQADLDRKVKHDALKSEVERAKSAALQKATDSKGKLDAARITLITEQANALQKRIESGEFDLKDDLLRAQIAHLGALTSNNGQPQGALGQDALDIMANTFLKTGQIPITFRGKEGENVKRQILNRAAEISGGSVRDVAGVAADFKANQASQVQMQKSYDAIVAFENTGMKNIDLMIQSAKKLTDTGSPLLNRPIRDLQSGLFGNENVNVAKAARTVANNEIAKITTNPNLTGVLTDEARKEVAKYNPDNATLGQTIAVANLLKRDMENRKISMEDQLKAIRGRISGGAPSESGAPKVGEIRKGYRFKGGDPSNKANWEKVQ